MPFDRYVSEILLRKKSSTQDRDKRRINHLKAYFNDYSLVTVTSDVIAKYRDMRLSLGRKNDTVRLELSIIRHLFTVAMTEWKIGLPINPMDQDQVQIPKPGKGRNRRLEADEEDKIVQALLQYSNPMLRWIVCLAIETGMRRGEIVGLTRKQVYLSERYVMLPDTKNGTPRPVPLNLQATELFTQALNNPIRPADTDLIFFGNPGREGLRHPYAYGKAWQDIKKKQGIEDLRFHDLRHENVSRLVEAGMSDQSVSAISGHKSMQMLKRYTHLRNKALVAQLDAMDKRRADSQKSSDTHQESSDTHKVD